MKYVQISCNISFLVFLLHTRNLFMYKQEKNLNGSKL